MRRTGEAGDLAGEGINGSACYNRRMKLTLEEVKHIAELARLQLTDEELARYAEQLSDILDYAARLQSIDTSGISPTDRAITAGNVLREDQVRPGLSQQELLDNAPETEKGQFRVPPILE